MCRVGLPLKAARLLWGPKHHQILPKAPAAQVRSELFFLWIYAWKTSCSVC